MEVRVVRDSSILLPGETLDEVPTLGHLPGDGDVVSQQLVTGDSWARTQLSDVSVNGCWLVNANLGSTNLRDVTFDRCVFRGSTLVGSTWSNVVLRNVLFEDCRLDYATIQRARTAGPCGFVRCSLVETTVQQSTVTNATFDACRFAGTLVVDSDLRGADLRGNDLSGLIGVATLGGITIGEDQLPGLTEALVRDLELRVVAP
ncbi:MAG: pentapeptide repeat-containing protein [Micromonosporaceae bacterium]